MKKISKTAASHEPVFQALESAIRGGKGKEARAALQALKPSRLPREERAQYAQFSWRSGLPELGLRVLRPLVIPGPRKKQTATDVEKLEYAACLIKAGGVEEGISLLAGISANPPKKFLYQAYAHFTRWEHTESIPILESYIRLPISDYERLVGEMNLLAAYIFADREPEAESLFESLEKTTRESESWLLYGNLLELRSACLIREERWEEAALHAEKSYGFLREVGSPDRLLTEKWLAVCDSALHPEDPKALEKLLGVRKQAESRRHWESIRHCDYFQAILFHDEKALWRAYFGTPFLSFRRDLIRRYIGDEKADFAIPLRYLHALSEKPKKTLDLWSRTPAVFTSDQWNLLRVLNRDFYRPFQIASIFAGLFPGEKFHPNHSPKRIQEVIRRIRMRCRAHQIDLDVAFENGSYRLQGRDVGLLGALSYPTATENVFEILGEKLGVDFFSVQDAAKCLKQNSRTVLRSLNEGIELGYLEREGKGPATRYRILKRVLKVAS